MVWIVVGDVLFGFEGFAVQLEKQWEEIDQYMKSEVRCSNFYILIMS